MAVACTYPECLDLWVNVFNLEEKILTIHDGNGGKDRDGAFTRSPDS